MFPGKVFIAFEDKVHKKTCRLRESYEHKRQRKEKQQAEAESKQAQEVKNETKEKESKAQSELKASAKRDDQVTTVVMFLAHNGVNNPDIWEAWKCQHTIGYIVHCNLRQTPGSFEEKYSVPADAVVPTQWGTPSLVLAHQSLLKVALGKFPNAAIFYLVSGACLPLRDASFMMGMSCITRLTKVDTNDAYDCLPSDWNSEDLVSHLQWHALDRHHAKLVADFNFGQLISLHEKSSRALIPDEYMIGSALRHTARVNNAPWNVESDSVLTFAPRSNEHDSSPITWTTLYGKQRMSGDKGSIQICLADAVQMALTSDDELNHLFIRKVAPIDNLTAVLPWCKNMS